MKKLLLSALMVLCTSAMFAQAPDASQWTKGQDISDFLSWGNLDLMDDPFDYWTFNHNGGETTTTGGLIELYNGSQCDLFQVIELPAGMYKFECQAYYRAGTAWDADPTAWVNGNWENLAVIRAATGTYDIDSEEFTESASFESPLMPRLFDIQDYALYEADQATKDAFGWDPTDGWYDGAGTYGPTSVPGGLAWFDAEKYMPYDEDGEVYNTVTFFLAEPGYVKVGIQKMGTKDSDSFMATNFKMYFLGEANEEVLIEIAKAALEKALDKAEAQATEIGETFGTLGSLYSDELMELDYDDTSLESINDATQKISEIAAAYKKYYQDAQQLAALVDAMAMLSASTDYPGKAEFDAAIEAAEAVVNDGNTMAEMMVTDPEEYTNAKTALAEARVAYILSQEIGEEGYSNFSAAIATPFFCDDVYSPVWDEDYGYYVFADPDIDGTWGAIQEQDYKEARNANPDWTPIADNVVIYPEGTDVEGQWVIHSTTWHGGAPAATTMQHSYPAIGGWTESPSNDPEILTQTVIGLPNGYYGMSALMCNAGEEPTPEQYVFIQTTDGQKDIARLTQRGNPWWGGNQNNWRETVWEKLQTGMVKVSDGKVTIGSSSNWFYAVTGFQLYYYGETPDFTALLQESFEKVSNDAEERLSFPGDITKVQELLDQVVLPCTNFESYDIAKAAIQEAEEYINAAAAYLENWDIISAYMNLQLDYDDTSAEYNFLDVQFNEVLSIGENDDDTYLDAVAATEAYNAMVEYLNLRAQAEEAIEKNPKIADLIDEQNTLLLSSYSDAERINTLKSDLQKEFNRAMAEDVAEELAKLGIDKATEQNPVEITKIVKNPSYDEGMEGWVNATNNLVVDNNLHNAERWNENFNYYQTLVGLPAGAYEVQVQAYYRDGGITDGTAGATSGPYYNFVYTAGGDMNEWANANAELYVVSDIQERSTKILSICTYLADEPSYEEYISDSTYWETIDDPDKPGETIDIYEYTYSYAFNEDIDPETGELIYTWAAYPFDSQIIDGDDIYYVPNSMTGAMHRFNKSPEAYQNKIQVMVGEDGELTFGLRKSTLIGSDWTLFDNWRLFYLGKDVPSSINDTKVNTNAAATAIYNVSGVRTNQLQKGINIIRMADGTSKKVLIK